MKIDKTVVLGGLTLLGGVIINILNSKNESIKQEKMKSEIIEEVLQQTSKDK